MDQTTQNFKLWLEQTKDEPLEAMASFFDARIDDYEAHMSPWAAHYLWMAKLLPDATKTLLDLGCGSGLELDPIFARFPSLEVTGVDLSQRMLEKLRQKHPDKALTLVCGDYFLTAFAKGYFDAVVSFESLHHFTAAQKTALFEKIHGALRPGGVYLGCDYIATSPEMEELAFAECARRRQRDGFDGQVFVHFDTPLTLEHEMDAIRAAGFAQVELVGFLPGDDHTPMLRAVK